MPVIVSEVKNPVLQGEYGFAVTPHDTDLIVDDAGNTGGKTKVTLYVGTGGDVKVKMAGGQDVVFVDVPSGSFMPIFVTQVFDTGTDADDIVAIA